jgi:hypothetical protein
MGTETSKSGTPKRFPQYFSIRRNSVIQSRRAVIKNVLSNSQSKLRNVMKDFSYCSKTRHPRNPQTRTPTSQNEPFLSSTLTQTIQWVKALFKLQEPTSPCCSGARKLSQRICTPDYTLSDAFGGNRSKGFFGRSIRACGSGSQVFLACGTTRTK